MLVKGKERKTRDLDKCVKYEKCKVLVSEKDIKDSWKTYFYNLFDDGYDISPDSSRLDIRE